MHRLSISEVSRSSSGLSSRNNGLSVALSEGPTSLVGVSPPLLMSAYQTISLITTNYRLLGLHVARIGVCPWDMTGIKRLINFELFMFTVPVQTNNTRDPSGICGMQPPCARRNPGTLLTALPGKMDGVAIGLAKEILAL